MEMSHNEVDFFKAVFINQEYFYSIPDLFPKTRGIKKGLPATTDCDISENSINFD